MKVARLHLFAATAGATALGATPALAQSSRWCWWYFCTGGSTGATPATAVPEIDASTGLLALAAVMAGLAFMVERRRRARVKS